MMRFGGVDTYYDYDERQWKFRRLGGGPVHPAPVCPTVRTRPPQRRPHPAKDEPSTLAQTADG